MTIEMQELEVGNATINISNHGYERFVERIDGITDTVERRRYITEHKERLTKEIQALWKYAQYIWQGQLYGNITRKYWLRDNIVIVTDVQVTNIITLYKIDFGWGDERDRMLAESVMEEVRKQRDQLELEESNVQAVMEGIDNEVEMLTNELRAYEELVASTRQRINAKQEEKRAVRATTDPLRKSLELNLQRICNSLEYRRELQGNGNGGRR